MLSNRWSDRRHERPVRRGAGRAGAVSMVTLAVALTAAMMGPDSALEAQTAKAGVAVAPTPAGQPMRNASLDARVAHVRRLLRGSPLIDGHNDLPWAMREEKERPLDVVAYNLRQTTRGMTDIARLRKGMIGGQFWSVYIPGEVRDSGYARMQLEQIDIARRVIERYPDVLAPALTASDVRKAFAQGKIGSLLGMEGGHAIENSLGALRAYYALGARYMTLTHNVTLDWADAAADKPVHGGLTPFGEEVVREMNRLGMLVDLAHVSPGTMSDALDVSEAPVIFSHSNARALTDVPRNVPDSILARLPKNGGVVMVTFVPQFASQKFADYSARITAVRDSITKRFPNDNDAQFRAIAAWREANPAPVVTIGDVADHLDHIRKVAGSAHVGIGGDFDGITETVQGLEDVSKYPDLLAELVKRGWTDAELRALAGENVLRVLTRAEAVSARLRKERPASTKTIQQLDRKVVP
ncbi:dipeptidase [Gemmatimonas aurantiaca]|uniref:dipeptidase n=1 Tax=Gemmatimonas aurantiaca TaxID=173480 RepID=UPI00301D8F25